VQVVSDGVTIDLNGHALIGAGAPVGIEADAVVTVTNGVIRGFGVGIEAAGDVTLDNVRVAKNGTGLAGGVDGTFDVRHSFVNENTGNGIETSMRGVTVTDSQVNGNGGDGIHAEESHVVALRDVISRNRGYGIWNEEFGADLESNQVNANGLDGIFLGINPFPDDYIILSNTAVGNAGRGIVYAPQFVGVVDHVEQFEGNVAHDNALTPQCVNIFCRTS
jgi:hypothetical protein